MKMENLSVSTPLSCSSLLNTAPQGLAVLAQPYATPIRASTEA